MTLQERAGHNPHRPSLVKFAWLVLFMLVSDRADARGSIRPPAIRRIVIHHDLAIIRAKREIIVLDNSSGRQAWRRATPFDVRELDVADSDLVVAVGPKDAIGLNIRTGVVRWRTSLPEQLRVGRERFREGDGFAIHIRGYDGIIALVGGTAAVGFDSEDGTLRWKQVLTSSVGVVLRRAGSLLIGAENGSVWICQLAKCELKELAKVPRSPFRMREDGRQLFVTAAGPVSHAASLTSGTPTWTLQGDLTLTGSEGYVAVADETHLTVIDRLNGKLHWRRSFPTRICTIYEHGPSLIAHLCETRRYTSNGAWDDQVVAVDADTGDTIWQIENLGGKMDDISFGRNEVAISHTDLPSQSTIRLVNARTGAEMFRVTSKPVDRMWSLEGGVLLQGAGSIALVRWNDGSAAWQFSLEGPPLLQETLEP